MGQRSQNLASALKPGTHTKIDLDRALPRVPETGRRGQELLVASDVAFSMSSTVSLESVCVGTPAAFMLIGHTPPHPVAGWQKVSQPRP